MTRLYWILPILLVCVCAQAKSYRVLAEDNWPPFSYVENGRLQGVSVDLVRAALEIESSEVELLQVPYLRCLALTAIGKEPGCFNSAKNQELVEKYVFPEEHLFRSRGLIVTNRHVKKTKPIRSLRELEGETVAHPSGFPFGKDFDDNKKILKQFTANDMTSLKLVVTGRINYAAIDEMVLYYYLERNPQFRGKVATVLELTNEPIYVHLSRSHPQSRELKEKLDRGLRKLKASNDYARIMQRWLGKDIPLDNFR
ncbi:hypothetical protein Bb109J_c0447 [Bdellovibrio bacteriovorus]|uniref:substrate-binding periplasmic protein n=1 Tax=Bdellovibrio bacteriovorus TaxID=959 RepID=UPI00045BEEB9|nr:transporter substrate-binding domain-containing protein [Bdellovibrio bacteriovorus]AHZ86102.1 ABC transporter substrate-binding protein [Bdellovibrio bacteriovorus]BEV67027.1 hypothetical protein Bb109J_c0447 [Bdellovibrio bacteriovorus]